MKRILSRVLVFFTVMLFAGSAWAAPPAGWDNVFPTNNNAFLSGTISINGVPIPLNPANILAAFAPGVANPVGTATDGGGNWVSAGSYDFMNVYADDGTGTKNGAITGDNITFQFYSADLDQVLTAYTMQNVSDSSSSFIFPAGTFPEKTINFDFVYDAPPVWTAVPSDGLVTEGTTIGDVIQATDANNDTVTYGVTGLPSFCSFGVNTGAISCSPQFTDNGVYANICFSAFSTGSAPTQFAAPNPACVTLTVLDNNRASVLTPSAPVDNVILFAGTPTTVTLTATDPDADNLLTWTIDPAMPAFCAVIGSGNVRTLSCTPAIADQGQGGDFTITVNDGTVDTVLTVTGNVVNRKPVIDPVPAPQNVSYAKATPTTIPIVINDADGNAITASNAEITPAATWFAYDPGTRTITVTPPLTLADVGNYTVVLSAIDDGTPPLAADNVVFGLNIVNQITWDNAIAATTTVPEGGTVTLNAKATDPFAKPITYTNPTGLPAFCSLDPATRIVTCNPGFFDNGAYTMSFTASAGGFDAQPNPMTTTLTVTNTNRPPVMGVDNATIQNLTLYAGVPLTRVFNAVDPDTDNTAPLAWSTVNLPPFCQFTPAGTSATLSCLPTLADQGGSGAFDVVVTDGIASPAMTVSGSVVNRQPVIGAIATQTISNLKATPTAIPVSITDADGNAISASNAVMTPARPWFSYDSGTRTITVTGPIDNADLGAYSVAVSATDNGVPALSADNVVFALNIVQQLYWDNVIAPTYTIDEGASLSFSAAATNPLGGPITYGGVALPAFCSIDGSRLVTCNPSFTDNGVYNLSFTASGDGYDAQPNPMASVLTVVNVNRAPVVTPATAIDITGPVGTTFSQAFIGSDLDNEALTWNVAGLPAFCTLTAATPVTPAIVLPPSGAVTRSVSCSPTSVNQQGSYPVTLGVSDGIDNTTRPFTITVSNRAPAISAIPTQSVDIDNTLTIPVVVTDPDGNAVTFDEVSIAPALSAFSFDPGTATITIGPGLTAADVRSDYLITVRATDNSVSEPLAAPTVTATLKVFYPRRFAPPAAAPGTPVMTFSGTIGNLGSPAAFSDEVAAYSVHKIPGSNPARWETKLVGAGRIEDVSGGLVPMAVLGDNPATTAVKEGCIPGEEVLLVLSHNLPGGGFQEYFAFDNGAGGPLSVAWNAAGGTADPNFIPGNRYPIRTGAWNLISYGLDSAWSASVTQPATALTGVMLNWTVSPDLSSAFPLASIAGKFDRILGNSGTGGTRMLVAGGASNLASLQPGLGYLVKARSSDQELAWMTVPGNPVPPTLTIDVPQGYALLGFWDEASRYRADGYNDNTQLASLRTLVENGTGTTSTAVGASIGQVWSSIAGRFDRTIVYDAGGAKIFIQAIPPQFNTMKFIAPGYGYWIKVTDPAGAPVGIGLLD